MNSRKDEDRKLVERVRNGDTHAFDTLMLRYRPPLARYLQRLVHDTDDTEDIVQETFIKAYRAIGRFRGDAAFSTWIFRIGINTAKYGLAVRNRLGLRRGGSGGDDDDSQSVAESLMDVDTPESQLESKEALALLDAALQALPEEQRVSFELRAVEGLTYDQIAEEMHCPVGTVRSRIHRARDTLAAALRNQ